MLRKYFRAKEVRSFRFFTCKASTFKYLKVFIFTCLADYLRVYFCFFNPKSTGLFAQLDNQGGNVLPIFTPDQLTVSHMKTDIFC